MQSVDLLQNVNQSSNTVSAKVPVPREKPKPEILRNPQQKVSSADLKKGEGGCWGELGEAGGGLGPAGTFRGCRR